MNLPISIKGIIFDSNKVWLRKNPRNEWELPGGRLEEGEQPSETLAREIKEELGFKIKVDKLNDSGVFKIILASEEKSVFIVTYSCSILSKSSDFEIISEDEMAEFDKFSLEEIKNLKIPDLYWQAIQKAAPKN